LGLQDALSQQEVVVPQHLLAQFPTRINRENILKNREFSSQNRESRRLRGHFFHTGVF
jgi:hypothetical protein